MVGDRGVEIAAGNLARSWPQHEKLEGRAGRNATLTLAASAAFLNER
jgi:hypothetical protein